MRKLILAVSAAVSLVQLSGCVPLAATGVGVGVLMADDRRTAGTYIVDEEIEIKAGNRLHDALGEKAHVNVTSYNRRVLLTGEAADAALRDKAEGVVKEAPNVREVLNEVIVGGATGFLARSNDAFVTAKVKTRLLDDRRFNAHHIKVVTEAGTVFLMGLVKRQEGAAAAEVAAHTSGVSRVVKVFEYQD